MGKIPFSVYDFFGYLASGFLLCAALDYVIGKSWIFQETLPYPNAVFWLTVAYVVGQINANISHWLLERNLVGRVLGKPHSLFFQEKAPRMRSCLFPGYYEPLPRGLRERILSAAKCHGLEEAGDTLFHHVRTTAKRESVTWAKTEVFLERYGFSRNMSCALLLLTIGIGISAAVDKSEQQAGVAAVCLFAGIGMFYRYLKFFRQYSFEIFTSYPDIVNKES